MSDKKITDLPAGVLARADDAIEIVQFPGATPTSKQVSMEELPFFAPDIPPDSPDALNDEFNDAATLPGGGSAQWAWVNQGTASVAIGIGGKGAVITTLSPGGVSNSLKCLEQTAPATPWEFTAKVALNSRTGTSFFTVGLFARESSSGKLMVLDIGYDVSDKLQILRWTNPTTFASEQFATSWATKTAYLRIADNGTNLIFSSSVDGLVYFPMYQEGRTAYMTGGANRVGICGNNAHATLNSYNSFHWFRRTA